MPTVGLVPTSGTMLAISWSHPHNTEWGLYSEEAVGKADISAVFSRKVLLLTFTWASISLIWLVTVRALMCSTRGLSNCDSFPELLAEPPRNHTPAGYEMHPAQVLLNCRKKSTELHSVCSQITFKAVLAVDFQ